MPLPGKMWRHVMINTHNTWLHGDPRGFRHRNHDIHSSGDYRNPPPPGEHAALHRYLRKRAGAEVHIERPLRPIIGRAIIAYLQEQGHRVLAYAGTKVHVHVLTELPHERGVVRRIVGHAKRVSSRAVKDELPGAVWSHAGEFKPVRDRGHLQNAHDYIIYDQGMSAWTWSYRDSDLNGVFGRRRPRGKRRAL